jgi:DNA-directed RNA polymerase subunit beta'
MADGICAKCYGLAETGHFHEVGTNIGVIAGHAMGEPATQLSMDAFHSGGVAASRGGASTDKFTRLKQLLEVNKTLPGAAALARVTGKVQKVELDNATNGHNVWIGGERHYLQPNRLPLIKAGVEVKKGQVLSDGPVNPHALLEHTDIHTVQNYLTDELHNAIYKDERVRRRNIETVVRAITNLTQVTDPGHSDHLPGDIALRTHIEEHNRNLKPGEDPIVHKPLLRAAQQVALDQHEDWMARLNFQRLRQTVLEGTAKGWKTDLHGQNPFPAYARGSEFGKGTPAKPHQY